LLPCWETVARGEERPRRWRRRAEAGGGRRDLAEELLAARGESSSLSLTQNDSCHGQDEGDEDRRIKYSRDSLLCLRGAASEACRDKLPAGIVACRKEVEAELARASSSLACANHSKFIIENFLDCRSPLACPGLENFLGPPLLMGEPEPRGSEPPQASAVRSKSKICTWFFSNADCRFGDNCRFLHHIPSSSHEQAAVGKKMKNLKLGLDDPAPARAPTPTTPTTVKIRLCKNHDTPEGCKWGDRCHLAHGDGELGKPMGPGSSFKTRLCVSFVTSGSCAFGRKCHFAHGKDELQSSPDAESE